MLEELKKACWQKLKIDLGEDTIDGTLCVVEKDIDRYAYSGRNIQRTNVNIVQTYKYQKKIVILLPISYLTVLNGLCEHDAAWIP